MSQQGLLTICHLETLVIAPLQLNIFEGWWFDGNGASAGCKLARTAEAMDIIVIGTRSASSRHDLEALLRAADIISLHCPLTEATRNILG